MARQLEVVVETVDALPAGWGIVWDEASELETGSPLTRGMTVVDYWGVTKRAKNAVWVRSGDSDGFFQLLTERIGRLP